MRITVSNTKLQGNIANSPEDYMQIQNLMIRFGIMTRVSIEEFLVPYIKANSHRRTIDARAVAYDDCPYLHKFAYMGTPEHFFWRLSVSLAATFQANQIGLNFSAHYNRGTANLCSVHAKTMTIERKPTMPNSTDKREGMQAQKFSYHLRKAKKTLSLCDLHTDTPWSRSKSAFPS